MLAKPLELTQPTTLEASDPVGRELGQPGDFSAGPSTTDADPGAEVEHAALAWWHLVQAPVQRQDRAPQAPVADSWTLQHPVVTVLIGIGVLLVIFVPLAIRRFSRITAR